MGKTLNRPILLFVIQILAFWPVWRWYFLRIQDTQEDMAGCLALAAAAWLIFHRRRSLSETVRWNWKAASVLTLVYAFTFPLFPPLVRAIIAMTAISAIFAGNAKTRITSFHIWGLLMLSLPSLPTLQFYLGYPLRAMVGTLSSILLQLTGFSVIREGACLNWGGQLVWIDAPCSGIKMLWASFFLAFLLAAIYRVNFRNTGILLIGVFLTVLVGNSFRATALFYVETGLTKFPNWSHEAIGVVVFGFVVASIVTLVNLLDNRRNTKCEPLLFTSFPAR